MARAFRRIVRPLRRGGLEQAGAHMASSNQVHAHSSIASAPCPTNAHATDRAPAPTHTVHFLGYFSEELDAARAHDKAAKKLKGKAALLNFPNPGEHLHLKSRVHGA